MFHEDISQLLNYLHTYVAGGQKKLSRQSVFSLRTEEGSAKQYFQFYGFLSQQQNMMQVRCEVLLLYSFYVYVAGTRVSLISGVRDSTPDTHLTECLNGW